MDKTTIRHILAEHGLSDGKDYWFIGPSWDEMSPLSEITGRRMARLLTESDILMTALPKAEPYYSDVEDRVYVCGYAR